MKCAVVFAGGMKQIMLTPENKDEKFALSLITPDDDISIEVQHGSFRDKPTALGYHVAECQGGYLRAFSDSSSVMLVLRKKEVSDD